mgnify:FL=1
MPIAFPSLRFPARGVVAGAALLMQAHFALAQPQPAPSAPPTEPPKQAAVLAPFTSDGCSLFPDRAPVGNADWCTCCVEHDIAYWRGGTAEEREQADQRLRACVTNKTGDQTLGETMYLGVRAGGGPYFLTWYRWGYGWPYGRGYQALSAEERAQADRLEREYRAAGAPSVCKKPDASPSVEQGKR